MGDGTPREVTLLDYGAGNVRSVRNAIAKVGYKVKDVTCVEDIETAKVHSNMTHFPRTLPLHFGRFPVQGAVAPLSCIATRQEDKTRQDKT